MAAPMRAGVFVVALVISFVLGEVYVFSLDKERRARALRTQFSAFMTFLVHLGCRYLWNRLVIKVQNHLIVIHQNHYVFYIWRSIVFIFLFCAQISYMTNAFFMSPDVHWFSYMCYICLGTLVQLVTSLGILDLLNWIILKANFNSKYRVRSDFKAIIAVVYAITMVSHGLWTTTQPPSLKKIMIPIQHLPPSLQGTRIVQLTDIHLGPTVGREKLQRLVNQVNQIQPDIVVITGDLVDSTVEKIKDAAEPLKNLKQKYGVYFVSGNHEYYTGDVDAWFQTLEHLGVQVLHNKNVHIPPKGGKDSLCLAGVDDLTPDTIPYDDHGMKLDKALQGCDPARPIILLAHQPKAAKRAIDSEHNIQLVLSGHTHGGQMFPLMIGAYLLNPYYVGLYKEGSHSYVYVSMGTFYWGIPLRILTSMEITEITLTQG